MKTSNLAFFMAAALPPENLSDNLNTVITQSMNLSPTNRTTFALLDSNQRSVNAKARETQTAKATGNEVLRALEDTTLTELDESDFKKKYPKVAKYGLETPVRQARPGILQHANDLTPLAPAIAVVLKRLADQDDKALTKAEKEKHPQLESVWDHNKDSIKSLIEKLK